MNGYKILGADFGSKPSFLSIGVIDKETGEFRQLATSHDFEVHPVDAAKDEPPVMTGAFNIRWEGRIQLMHKQRRHLKAWLHRPCKLFRIPRKVKKKIKSKIRFYNMVERQNIIRR